MAKVVCPEGHELYQNGFHVNMEGDTCVHGHKVDPDMWKYANIGIAKGEEGNYYEKARDFMVSVGLEPTPDAVRQLSQAFVPALRIMCERGYDPEGQTWQDGGWRGLVYELRKKVDRLWHRSWLGTVYDPDSALDMMNYSGMYYRLKCQGKPWGKKGEPDTTVISKVGMGDYSELS